MKRIGLVAWLLVALFLLAPQAAFSGSGATLLLVPRADGPVRLGMDVGARYPTMLISYKLLPTGSVSLHGWSGTEWVNVTPESFAEGSFFRNPPDSAVVVWNGEGPLPDSLMPAQEWCPEAYVVSSTEMRAMIHLLGRHYNFKYEDWKWFSENYKLPFDSINPESLNVYWYHRRLRENLKQQSAPGTSDLECYAVIYGPLPVADNESDVRDEEPVDPASGTDDEAIAGDENPLTNAVPQAMVLGPGEAGEAAAEKPSESADVPEEPVEND